MVPGEERSVLARILRDGKLRRHGYARHGTAVRSHACELNEEGQRALKWERRTGQIVGESRDKKCWWVIWDDQKTRNSFHKDFIKVIPKGKR